MAQGRGPTHVVTLLRADEPAFDQVAAACRKLSIQNTHMPISGANVGPQDADNLGKVSHLLDLLRRNNRVMLHCAAGMHRTGLVSYMLLRLAGWGPAEAEQGVLAMRVVTHEELVKTKKDKLRLVNVAEQCLANYHGTTIEPTISQ